MEALLNVVENTAGDCTKADDAEQHVADELKKMGNDVLYCWAEKAVEELRVVPQQIVVIELCYNGINLTKKWSYVLPKMCFLPYNQKWFYS